MSTMFATVFCDECKHEFSMNSVDIQTATVELGGQALKLVYFTCPKCNKIYRVSIQDKRYYELKEDLDKTKKRIRRLNGSKNFEMTKTLNSMVIKKHERLKAYVEAVHKVFPGEFVFVSSESNPKEKSIKYLP